MGLGCRGMGSRLAPPAWPSTAGVRVLPGSCVCDSTAVIVTCPSGHLGPGPSWSSWVSSLVWGSGIGDMREFGCQRSGVPSQALCKSGGWELAVVTQLSTSHRTPMHRAHRERPRRGCNGQSMGILSHPHTRSSVMAPSGSGDCYDSLDWGRPRWATGPQVWVPTGEPGALWLEPDLTLQSLSA